MDVRDGRWAANKARVEIDTRPPFRSVKEAVTLFGERVSNNSKGNGSNPDSMVIELQKAKQETASLTNQMCYLKEELESTKRELQELKGLKESKIQLTKMMADLQDMEDLKYDVINSPEQQIAGDEDYDDEGDTEFQKKRYVTSFAYPVPSKIINVIPTRAVLERDPSLKKNKKKKNPFSLPLIKGIFPMRRTKCDPY